ncbi:hypothetical protein ACFYUV_25905 [Nonomuraea sp. NPDC003560]|uniref:hypothetical protein n=1 Tax=Nonomuraea sp. NPDC003560 TaxID=3364341 RepID=UPI0036949115
MDAQGLHFLDLRHTGNTLAAQSGASLTDLKANGTNAASRDQRSGGLAGGA